MFYRFYPVVIIGARPLGMALIAAPAIPAKLVRIDLNIISGKQVSISTMSLILVGNSGVVDAMALASEAFPVLGEITGYKRMAMVA